MFIFKVGEDDDVDEVYEEEVDVNNTGAPSRHHRDDKVTHLK